VRKQAYMAGFRLMRGRGYMHSCYVSITPGVIMNCTQASKARIYNKHNVMGRTKSKIKKRKTGKNKTAGVSGGVCVCGVRLERPMVMEGSAIQH